MSDGMMNTPADAGLVLFDLDGTLVDTLDDVALAMNRALRELGLPETETGLARECLGLGGLAFPRAALARAGREGEALLAELNALYLEHYAQGLVEHSRLYPGAAAALDALAGQGAALGLCTNKLSRFTLPLLDSLGLAGRFDVIVCGDTLDWKKPDPRPLLHAAQLVGREPGAAALVGDTAIDRQAALAAGMRFIHARHGYGEGLDGEAWSVGALGELPALWADFITGAARSRAIA
ncbi:HAD-IA family hydrolase [Chromobacterium alticapitis]|uniref:phosphoglycolate phosphatase n=1 Tax=Chromobacterium alticapitis TaxID=2073169 RepID=A0A2S5DJ97_9NEIS|nr:HAD-IA family hydrolase [Chromobacterium alticapitis]POZ63117.1 phosphoglycolate phosphatase [Chromobacterium alticapitis]